MEEEQKEEEENMFIGKSASIDLGKSKIETKKINNYNDNENNKMSRLEYALYLLYQNKNVKSVGMTRSLYFFISLCVY